MSTSHGRRCRLSITSRHFGTRLSRRFQSRRCWRSRVPSIESLELRQLLAGQAMAAGPFIDTLSWNGEEILAMKGEWVARFDGFAGSSTQQISQLQGVLDSVAANAASDGAKAGGIGDLQVRRQLDDNGAFLVKAVSSVPYERLQERLLEASGFRYLEPNFLLSANATIPNDPMFADLWGLHNTGQEGGVPDADIDAAEAWDRAPDASTIVVASIDTGVDYTHEDLADNMWRNPGECLSGTCIANGVDDDGNGYIDDFYGIDTAFNDSDPFDGHGHGTHTVGTMGAIGDNGLGVAGVNWNIQFMALKFLNNNGSGGVADAIEVIDYMTMMKRDYGVNIVASNNSWSGGAFSQALQDSIQASNDEGIMFVAAAGNAGSNNDLFPAYPSSYPLDGIIAVAATDRNDALASFSNYGAASVDLGAPGVSILSTTPGDTYSIFSGTSMAAPHVTGVVASLMAAAPEASLAEIKAALLDNADPIPALDGVTLTGRRLNYQRALEQFGMRVVASQPASGEVLFAPPAAFHLDFSDPYDVSTIAAGDLLVNGIAADNVTLDDADSLTFTFNSTPVANEGLQTMLLAAGAVQRLDDGDLSVAFDKTFRYDATLLQVAGASPAEGATVGLPLNTLVLNFNEPLDAGSVGADDLILSQGVVAAAVVLDTDTVQYTLDQIDAEGIFTYRLPAGGIADVHGNPSDEYTGSLTTDVVSRDFPLPLQPLAPSGSLSYSGSRLGEVSFPSDSDAFTIDVAQGQALTVLVRPDSSLQPTVELRDPNSVVLASDSAASASEEALLQGVATLTSGSYTVSVGGVAGATGQYTLELLLNAVVEEEEHGAAQNNSLAQAQSLDGSWVAINAQADRAALLGSLPDSLGIAFFAENFDGPSHSFTLDQTAGEGLWKSSTGRQLDGLPGHSPSGNLYFGSGEDDLSGGNYDTGSTVAGSAISPWISLPDSGQVTLRFNHFLDTEDDPSWDQAEVLLDDGLQTFTLLSTEDGSLPTSTNGVWESVTADLTEFRGRNARVVFAFDSFDEVQNQQEGWFLDDVELIGTAASVQDFYAFDLSAGDNTTLAATSLAGKPLELELWDDAGVRLALGGAADNLTASISSFVAPQSETYYVKVSGQGDYSLIVSRNANVDREQNDSLASAQPLTTDSAWGYLRRPPAASSSSFGGAFSGGSQPNAPYQAGQLIVRFSEELSDVEISTLIQSQSASVAKELPIARATLLNLGLGQADVQAASLSWAALPEVVYAEPNYLVSVEQTLPDDPLFGELWAMNNTGQNGGVADADIDAAEAWQIATDASSVVVASIDTGVDYTHEDLAANIWTNPIECPGGVCVADGVDDDGNGYIDDFHGIDTAQGDSDPMDGHGHGTHTSGTMGAAGDNGLGVAGINWNIQFMALKFLTDGGSGSIADAIEAIDYMTTMKRDYGVNVVASNNSWSGGGYSQALRDSIEASNNEGIMFVAAAGNDGNNNDSLPAYPSSYTLDGLISVAATDRNDNLASFSNYGATSVDLGAPGVSILSTVPGNSYSTSSGTSMAAPHVTGVVASLTAASPTSSLAEIKAAMLANADPAASLEGATLTGGRLNLHKALLSLVDPGDYYRVQVADGDVLTISTSTPGDGPFGFGNSLDPELELYDPQGNLASSDDNSGGDGKNALLSFTATETGVYTVRVLAAGGSGEYLLQVSGDQGAAPAPVVAASSPADGETVLGSPAELVLTFGDPLLLSSLSPADLLVDGVPVLGVRDVVDDQTIVLQLPTLSEGSHTLQLPADALADVQGRWFATYQATFTVDLSTHPISTDELIAYWSLDDGSGGTAADTSLAGADHSGLVAGDAQWTSFGLNGSLDLDGDNDYVVIPDSNDLNLADQRDRSVSAWFYLRDKTIATRKQVIFEEGGSTRGINVYAHDGRLYVGGWNDDANQSNWTGTFLSTDLIASEQWHHVTLTLDGGRTIQPNAFSLYLDGVLVGGGDGSRLWGHSGDSSIGQVTGFVEAPTGTTKFHTGNETADGNALWGSVDEVRVYNRVLSSNEIQALAAQSLVDPLLLTLSVDAEGIWETGSATATLTRSGDTSAPLDVAIESSDPLQATVPDVVSFPAFASQVSFPVTGFDDALADGTRNVSILASASGYLRGRYSLEVWDDEPAEANLVAYWNFNEGAGSSAADTSPEGSDNSGSLQQASDWNVFGLNGSLTLDEEGGLVTVPDSTDINTAITTQRTISAWFYVHDASINTRKQVLYEEGGSSRGMNIYLSDGSLYVGGWNDDASQSGWSGTFLSTVQIQSATWHHVLVTLDGGASLSANALRGYLDGVLFGEGSGSQLWSRAGDIGIGQTTGQWEDPTGTTKYHAGNAPADGDHLFGLVDELRIYNRVLTDPEIQVLTGQSLAHPALLSLSIAPTSIWEGGASATATITRDGDTSNPLLVTLTSNDPSEATLPATVTIAANASQATFLVTPADDDLADGQQTVKLIASADGYLDEKTTVEVLDDEPAEADLVAYWNFDEGGGATAADTSPYGSNNTGTLQQAADWISFGLNGSLSLGEGGALVAVPDSADINTSTTTQRTISGWFYVHDASINSRKQVLFEEGGSTRGTNIYVHDGQLFVGGWNADASQSGWGGAFLSTDQIESARWHHVALVLDGDETIAPTALRGYLDGSLFGEGPGSQIWHRAGDIGIGQVTGAWEHVTGTTKFHTGDAVADGDGLAGLVDEMRVYNRALTDAEIQVLAGQSLVEPGLLTISFSPTSIQENGPAATATITRDGDTSNALLVSLASSDTGEATVPLTVTIPAAASQASFPVVPVDDGLADGSQLVTVSATAAGYLERQATLEVHDDEPAEIDLVAYWTFNEGSGNVAGDTSPSGGANPITLQGDAGWNEFGLDGSLTLDGDGDYVNIPDSADINLNIAPQRTIAAWFYADDVALSSRKQVIYEEGGTGRGLNIYVSDGALYVGGWNDDASQSGWAGTFLSTDQIASGQWRHVALVLDGGTSITADALRGYLDGTEFGVGAGSQIWAHGGDAAIGRVDGAADYLYDTTRFHDGDVTQDGHEWAGMIDEVRVYNRALIANDVQILAQQTLANPQWLDLSIAASSIAENAGTVQAVVNRPGDTSGDLIVTLSSDSTTAQPPASVTILAGQSQVAFDIAVIDDTTYEGDRSVTITAAASGFLDDIAAIQILEDDLPDGDLVAYWSFDEGSGATAADIAPGGVNDSGALIPPADWNEFGAGGSLSLYADGDYVAVADSSDLNLSTAAQRSISVWFYVHDKDDNTRKQVLFEDGGTTRGMNLYVFDGSLYVGGWNDDASQSGWAGTFLSTDQIQSATWHHVTLVLDGGPTVSAGAVRGYLDGASFGQGAGSQIWSRSGDVGIGKVTGAVEGASGTTRFHDGDAPADGHGFAGLMDELRVYNRALSDPEIQLLSAQLLATPAALSMSVDNHSLVESGGTATATLTRSGDTSQALLVAIVSSDTSEAAAPGNVTIPAGASQITFVISAQDDAYYDGPQAVTVQASAPNFLTAQSSLTIQDDESLLRTGVVSGVSNAWTTVSLPQSYQSMVVVATPNYTGASVPLVTRIQNASGSSFDLRVDRADGATGALPSVNVHYLVVEEGVYTAAEHGVKMEAVTFTSTVTDSSTSWNGQSRAYANSYSQPVVVGQVMSHNDPDYSVFWTRGSNIWTPPSSSVLRVGKHVGADSDKTRAAETIGYVVIEAGLASVDGRNLAAGLGADIVMGVEDSPPYNYAIAGLSAASTAVVSQAGMDGYDGSWSILYGANPVSATSLRVAVDEDQMSDAERLHTTEQIAYLVFEDTALIADNSTVSASAQFVTGDRLTAEDLETQALQALVMRAAAYWRPADAERAAQLQNLELRVTDLPGQQLGDASPGVLWLDIDAAGHGWFIDPSPADQDEFQEDGQASAGGAAWGKMDLLTVLAHEMGHLLGHGHTHAEDGLMSATLAVGVRQLPPLSFSDSAAAGSSAFTPRAPSPPRELARSVPAQGDQHAPVRRYRAPRIRAVDHWFARNAIRRRPGIDESLLDDLLRERKASS